MSFELWINPFLDDFYEWGEGEYWNNKREFLGFLDTNPMNPVSHPPENVKRIENYIKENVPLWYYIDGFNMEINGVYLDLILDYWINDKPFIIKDVEYMSYEQDEDYPKELKVGGKAIMTYQVERSPSTPTTRRYVKILKLTLPSVIHKRYYNALYFTGVKGKSWCNIQEKGTFINWPNEYPLEVKE